MLQPKSPTCISSLKLNSKVSGVDQVHLKTRLLTVFERKIDNYPSKSSKTIVDSLGLLPVDGMTCHT